jgi:hypothetical protein
LSALASAGDAKLFRNKHSIHQDRRLKTVKLQPLSVKPSISSGIMHLANWREVMIAIKLDYQFRFVNNKVCNKWANWRLLAGMNIEMALGFLEFPPKVLLTIGHILA